MRETISERELLEKLSSLEHDQWIELIKYLINMGQLQSPYKEHCEKLFISYNQLTEKQKESDRIFARKVLELVKSYIIK
jgi:hypothetical protein